MASNTQTNTTGKRGRNWTKEETELFVEVITDANDDFAVLLERKALKKASNKIVFEDIMLNFNKRLQDLDFISENEARNFTRKGKTFPYTKLLFEGDHGIKKLQIKYKDVKDRWRKITDAARRGSGEEGATDEKWYQLINPILAERNGDLGEIVNGPHDTSLYDDVDDTEDYDDDIFINDIYDHGPPKRTKKTELPVKPKLQVKNGAKKKTTIRTQTQGLTELSNSVKLFGEQQSHRFESEMEENLKRDEKFLAFKVEQRELDRQHELKMFEMMMQYQYGRNVASQATSFPPGPSQQQNVPPLDYSFQAPQESNPSSPTYPWNAVPLPPQDSFTSSPADAFPRPPSSHPLVNLSSQSQTLQTSQMEFNKPDLREINYPTNGNYPRFGDQMFK